MPNLRDFERRLGGLVEGLFSKTFRSGVQPIEMAKLMMREMEAGRTVGVSEVWAPNRFVLTLSGEDRARFEQAEAAIGAELRSVVEENAAERGWGLVGPPEVIFETGDSLKKGDLRCQASLKEGPVDGLAPAPASVSAPTTSNWTEPLSASLVVHETNGTKTVRIDGEVVSIGRMQDCDVMLEDKGASRRHAQIRRMSDGFSLIDLGSTNGTLLNGKSVQSQVLRDGDRITIGATQIDFRQAG